MRRCRTCCYPDQKPDLYFDASGECSACINARNKPLIDWDLRKQELIQLLDRHDGKCIVPSSGGKDSTAQVLAMLAMGAEVTIVTAPTCYLTKIGRMNIDNLARFAKTVEYECDKDVRKKINRIGLEMVGDISLAEHWTIFSTPFRASIELGIPLIMYGENSQHAYGGPLGSETANQLTRRWGSEFGGFLGCRPVDMVGLDGITDSDMDHYRMPSDEDMARCGVEAHFLGYYQPWDSRANAEIAEKNGMTQELPTPANWWKAENIDNGMHGIHCHLMYRKYGYGRGAAQISVDVRDGLINRASAMEWIKDHDGLFPYEYAGVPLQEILDHLDLPFESFRGILNNFTNQDLFEGEINHRPILKEFAQ